MKKTIFAVALVAIMGLALASCQNDTLDSLENGAMQTRATTTYTVGAVTGNYSGALDSVVMNGNLKPAVSNRTVTINANSTAGKFNIYMAPFQVGSMPGTITIDAKGITLNADGTFSATDLQGAVILTLPLIGARPYPATLVSGKFVQRPTGGYDLEFGIDSQGTFGIITIFTAHVHFTGSK